MTTTKPTTRTRKPRTENTTAKENDMTATIDAAAQPIAGQRPIDLPTVLADPDRPQWRDAGKLLDLALCLAADDASGLDQHRQAWTHHQRRRQAADHLKGLVEAADAARERARRAYDAGAPDDEILRLYREARRLDDDRELFDRAIWLTPRLDYRPSDRWASHTSGADAANEALANGLRQRRLRVAAYCDAELARAELAKRVYGAPDYTLPTPLKITDLEAAAKPIRLAERHLAKLEEELRRGGREAGNPHHPDDVRRHMEIIEIPNARFRLEQLRSLAPGSPSTG